MPKDVSNKQEIQPGDIYEDSYCHPCLCVEMDGDEVKGISLVDGSYPRSEDLRHSGIRLLSPAEALQWRLQGPADKEVDRVGRWWQRDKPGHLVNPSVGLENLFFFALYSVEWSAAVQEKMGGSVRHEWHNVQSQIEENNGEGRATVRFQITNGETTALVSVQAFKAGNDWPIDELSVQIGEEKIQLIKNGKNLPEQTDGCEISHGGL